MPPYCKGKPFAIPLAATAVCACKYSLRKGLAVRLTRVLPLNPLVGVVTLVVRGNRPLGGNSLRLAYIGGKGQLPLRRTIHCYNDSAIPVTLLLFDKSVQKHTKGRCPFGNPFFAKKLNTKIFRQVIGKICFIAKARKFCAVLNTVHLCKRGFRRTSAIITASAAAYPQPLLAQQLFRACAKGLQRFSPLNKEKGPQLCLMNHRTK